MIPSRHKVGPDSKWGSRLQEPPSFKIWDRPVLRFDGSVDSQRSSLMRSVLWTLLTDTFVCAAKLRVVEPLYRRSMILRFESTDKSWRSRVSPREGSVTSGHSKHKQTKFFRTRVFTQLCKALYPLHLRDSDFEQGAAGRFGNLCREV